MPNARPSGLLTERTGEGRRALARSTILRYAAIAVDRARALELDDPESSERAVLLVHDALGAGVAHERVSAIGADPEPDRLAASCRRRGDRVRGSSRPS